jgi:phytol kinase
VARQLKINAETSRKFVHVVAGVMTVLLPHIITFAQIRFISALFIPVMLASKRLNVFESIHKVARRTYGEIYFPLSILLVATAFPHTVIFSFGVLVMALGDGLASIIGQRYGKQRYNLWAAEKSYIGSSVFWLTVFVICLASFAFYPISVWEAGLLSVAISSLLTLTEASLAYGLDNLVLPLLASTLLSVVIHIR